MPHRNLPNLVLDYGAVMRTWEKMGGKQIAGDAALPLHSIEVDDFELDLSGFESTCLNGQSESGCGGTTGGSGFMFPSSDFFSPVDIGLAFYPSMSLDGPHSQSWGMRPGVVPGSHAPVEAPPSELAVPCFDFQAEQRRRDAGQPEQTTPLSGGPALSPALSNSASQDCNNGRAETSSVAASSCFLGNKLLSTSSNVAQQLATVASSAAAVSTPAPFGGAAPLLVPGPMYASAQALTVLSSPSYASQQMAAASLRNGPGCGSVEVEVRTRQQCLDRYRAKKARRLYTKKIRYQLRKINADKRPRIKGRFVKKDEGEGVVAAAAAAAAESLTMRPDFSAHAGAALGVAPGPGTAAGAALDAFQEEELLNELYNFDEESDAFD